ncbi:MAG: hypothetical protein ACD_44C00427G0005 [uncultured bacterium]|nr:MAG: hypothetical protein ACD_44C00427G0005 [uncultured bacterium]OGT16705.1 MAG: Tol-Pal system beta propeller repeat protein TolB [Gammaproteobacteria bacterium RIFCSPHIGHO2_02_FULL_38_33]OGT24530.1 MAG: Tol-Pal system beta propeller repeat protein TolB [Gammaproteobacteria bacterium RIFCSPHIGHO2_12_38_15]OGT67275.1 MAG: Tol-Pal system beta propeller repeat protein TolB [Gammaproteobacteria bacterium RIFCSPLOWO2_02_FULL_38_11]OGT76857.1 MAG: Tol-Pal system beta propeller repeat protein Tol
MFLSNLERKFLFIFLLMPFQVQAILNLELTQGMVGALPIAVVPFEGQSRVDDGNNIAKVVSADLQNSGRFNVLPVSLMKQFPTNKENTDFNQWKNSSVDNLVVGKVQSLGQGRVRVEFSLLDVFKGTENGANQNPIALTQTWEINSKDLRRIAHRISDLVYEKMIGQRGIFSTRIAYVTVQSRGENKNYKLEIADADGYNPQPILISPEPIMSPAWSHRGRKVAYVSFENKRATIYVTEVATGQREKVSSYPGINGAPAWSPDDSKLALVLSKSGFPKIYILDLKTKALQQVTTGSSIDTEPSWFPDGKSLVFTSDRSGGPQIYRVYLTDGRIERLTYSGPYNARASVTPEGNKMIMLHRAEEGYTIAFADLNSGSVQLLSRSGRDESPSLAPNGSMVLFGNEYGVLGIISTDGRVQLRLPAREGEVRSPAWSGFLS